MAEMMMDDQKRRIVMHWKKYVGELYFRQAIKPTEPLKVIDWTIEQIVDELQKRSIIANTERRDRG